MPDSLLIRSLKNMLPYGVVEARRRARSRQALRARGEFHPAGASFSLPTRTLDDLFPGCSKQETTVTPTLIPDRPDMVMPLAEVVALGAIVRYLRPRRMFELGTFTGASTLTMALNSPPDAEIFTLDLDPNGRSSSGASSDVGDAFRNHPQQAKIHQLYGDSRTFDFSPYFENIDFILVDADHSYPAVLRDSETAFRLARPGAVIIWDDYRWDEKYPECSGVTRCLNELEARRPVFQLDQTRFAISLTDRSLR